MTTQEDLLKDIRDELKKLNGNLTVGMLGGRSAAEMLSDIVKLLEKMDKRMEELEKKVVQIEGKVK